MGTSGTQSSNRRYRPETREHLAQQKPHTAALKEDAPLQKQNTPHLEQCIWNWRNEKKYLQDYIS
jgi:hypothetical protein